MPEWFWKTVVEGIKRLREVGLLERIYHIKVETHNQGKTGRKPASWRSSVVSFIYRLG